MRRILVLLAIALPLVAAVPNVTIVSVDGKSHSIARINFTTDVDYDAWRTLAILSPGTCASGDGYVSPSIPLGPGVSFPHSYSVLVAALTANSTWKVCVNAHNSDGWSTGAETTIITDALPSVHPALPIHPVSFNSAYPDTTGYTSVTTASDCSDLNSKISDAQWAQATHGTIINIPAGSVCTGLTQVQFPVYALDIVPFRASDITAGTPGVISFPHATFTEGQLVTFGRRYADGGATPPSSGSCMFGNGFTDGGKYYIHIASDDGTHQLVNLDCGDGSNSRMAFADVGSTIRDLQFVPYFQETGTCPSHSGTSPCTYWVRHLNWIVVRSGTADNLLPPVNTRASLAYADAGRFATLVVPTSNIGAGGSTGWFLTGGTADGQEETMTTNIHIGPGIKIITANDASQRTFCTMVGIAQWVSNYVLDRVILSGGGTPQRWGGPSCAAFYWNGYNFAFENSVITNLSQWHPDNASDGAGGIISRGPGPTVLYNNMFEGAGLMVHIDDGGGTEFVRGDNSIIRNLFYQPFKYMHGSAENIAYCLATVGAECWFGERQPAEIKNGFRNLFDGNRFLNYWNENSPSSAAIALTSVNGEGITDTDVINNLFQHGPGGHTIQGVGGNDRITLPALRFRAHNNLYDDIDGAKYTATNIGVAPGRGWVSQGPTGVEDMIFDGNTITHSSGQLPAFLWLSNYPTEGVQVTNNIMFIDAATRGIRQESVGGSSCTSLLAKALADCMFRPTYRWDHNVMLSLDSTKATIDGWYTGLTNYVPSDMSLSNVGWLNMALGDYRIIHNYCSGCASPGSNHQTIGDNTSEREAAMGKVQLTGVPEQGLTTTAAHVQFHAPDAQGCTVDWSTAPDIMASFTRVSDAGGARSRDITLTGLSAHTVYYYRVNCAVEQPTGQFKTK